MEQYLREIMSVNENGLYLCELPTGFGKTYTSVKLIADWVCNHTSDRKIIFLTTLNKNLPEEELRLALGETLYDKNVLRIRSNFDEVVEKLPTLAIPEQFQTESYQRLLRRVQRYQRAVLHEAGDREYIAELEKRVSEAESGFRNMITEHLRKAFPSKNKRLEAIEPPETESGLRILAVDGTEIQTPTDPDDSDSYYPGANGQQPYNMIHLNALYDLLRRTYIDAVIQKSRNQHERKALIEMIEASSVEKALVIADRGYESYNTMAHIHEKGWFYLMRIKDGKNGIVSGLSLPDTDEFELDLTMNLTRSCTKQVKRLFEDRNHYRFVPCNVNFDYLPKLDGRYGTEPVFYSLTYRVVRIRISEELTETLVTNLPQEQYPPKKLKELYALRWGIETSFRSLKYTVGMLHNQ